MAKIHSPHWAIGLGMSALIIASSGAQAASPYDIHTDFSIATNPTGVWSYGWEPTLGGAFTLYNENDQKLGNATIWNAFPGPQNALVPAVWNNATDTSIQPAGLDPAQSAAFHPGKNGELSIFRFTAPSSSIYDIATTMALLDSGDTNGYVLVNDVVVYNSGEMTKGDGIDHSFLDELALAAGDRVDFAIGLGTSGSFFNDSTQVSGTVTDVPEPASSALLVAGLLGLRAVRRRANA